MGIRILLADDSVTAQNMGKKILSEAGHDVVTVSNGAAAAKKIAEIKPDLALLDVFMPGYSGLELCEKLRNAAETTRLPVILTVGKMEPYSPQDGARVKADGVIIKPFEATDLTAAVERFAQKLTVSPRKAAQERKAQKPADYEATVRLDSRQIAEMLKSGSAEPAKTETTDPGFEESASPVSPQAEEFQIAPAAPEAATAAFAEDLTSAPKAESAPATVNSYLEEYLSDNSAAAVESPSPAFGEPTVETQHAAPLPEFQATPEGFEPTASVPLAELPVAQEPGFEATQQSSEAVEAITKDPALETDPHKATTAFPTKFGTPDIYEAPMANVSNDLIEASDAALEATISEHLDGNSHQSARPIDEFEARLQQAMAAYEPNADMTIESRALRPTSMESAEAADSPLVQPDAAGFGEIEPRGESAADLQPPPLSPEAIENPGEGDRNHMSIGAAESFEAQVEAAMHSFEEPGAEPNEAMVETQHAASEPAFAAEPTESTAIDAISSVEVPIADAEPSSVAHFSAPETDDAVIERMRESLSNLPVEHASMPELGSETDALPRAMAAAAAAAAPSFPTESAAHDAAFEITRALSYAVGAEAASDGIAASPAPTEEKKPADANKMASAVERVLQRELPSLVWKVMAEIDIEKHRR